jgi:hypothetical protein
MEGQDGEPVMFGRVLSLVKASRSLERHAAKARAVIEAVEAPMAAVEAAAAGVEEGGPGGGGWRDPAQARPSKRARRAAAAAEVAAPAGPEGTTGLQQANGTSGTRSINSSSSSTYSTAQDDFVPLPPALEQLIEDTMTRLRLSDAGSDEGEGEGDEKYSRAFCMDLREFLKEQVAGLIQSRLQLAAAAAIKAKEEQGKKADRGRGTGDVRFVEGKVNSWELERMLRDRGVTQAELHEFLRQCVERYEAKRIDPGSTVGAFGAQSIGEDGEGEGGGGGGMSVVGEGGCCIMDGADGELLQCCNAKRCTSLF